MSRLEGGRANATLSTLEIVSKALEVDVIELFQFLIEILINYNLSLISIESYFNFTERFLIASLTLFCTTFP